MESAIDYGSTYGCLQLPTCNRRTESSQYKHRKLITALLYAARIPTPRLVKLPVRVDYNNPVDASGWVDDVDTSHWFPHGVQYTKVDSLPGCTKSLRNAYTIVTSSQQDLGPHNRCVFANLGIDIRGNVVVIRHSSQNAVRATNLHSAERQFLDVLLERLVFVRDALLYTFANFMCWYSRTHRTLRSKFIDGTEGS